MLKKRIFLREMRPHFGVQLRNEVGVFRKKGERQMDEVIYLLGGVNNLDHEISPGALSPFRMLAKTFILNFPASPMSTYFLKLLNELSYVRI